MKRYRNNPKSGNNHGLLMRLLDYALTKFVIPYCKNCKMIKMDRR